MWRWRVGPVRYRKVCSVVLGKKKINGVVLVDADDHDGNHDDEHDIDVDVAFDVRLEQSEVISLRTP